MDNLFDTIADVGSDEEEDEDFEGEGTASKPKKTNGTNGIDDSSEEEDDDDEDRLRQASFWHRIKTIRIY
jgi:transcription elongation factor SPT6